MATSTQEDCPLCCDPMTAADSLYALHCPTPECRFNYCVNCIRALQKSAADGYQQASDGSNQVKVQVQCPQCRGKYASETYPSAIVVSSVLLLRKAVTMQDALSVKDSDLPASMLGAKHVFLRETSVEHLRDAVRRLQTYHTEIGQVAVPDLDWEEWSRRLPATAAETSQHVTSPQSQRQEPAFCDATLFLGLEELMTLDEQEFVTHLFCSGKPELLQQAAHILNGMLDVSYCKNASAAVRQLSLATAVSTNTSTTTARIMSKQELKDLQLARKRWPLPARMPRLSRLPVYDPAARGGSLKFHKNDDRCVLAAVRGPAGRSGMRVGDVVTHFESEPVESQDDFAAKLQFCWTEDDQQSVQIVVNADEEVAVALQERAREIKEHRIKVAEQQRQQYQRPKT